MLDIKFIRENPEHVKEGLKKKRVDFDLDYFLRVDAKRRALIKDVDELRAKHNAASEEIAGLGGAEKEKRVEEMKSLKVKLRGLELELKSKETEFVELMHELPNLPFVDVPVGKDESDNVVLREVGDKPQFNFKPRDYMEIAQPIGLIDTQRASKISGTRFGYLFKEAALLELALIHFSFKKLTEKGFVPVIPPVMIRPEVYQGMGRLSGAQKEERYYLPADNLYLVGSAEHTLGPLHLDEVLEEAILPRRYVGFSTCFRREAGSYGKDTKGILRVHQFDKVEMFSFSQPDASEEEHQVLLSLQEELMQDLGLPYRVVEISTGDLGWTDARQYDLEVWFPGQNQYRETHSCSNTTDFQARGINARYRKKDGKAEFVHMLNATGIAIGRTIIAIFENYQKEDGSVIIPDVLRPYMADTKEIRGGFENERRV